MTRVTAAVLRRGDEYLICRRTNGLWEFPGGKIESGETPEQCLIRECMEELSILIRVGELLERVETVNDDGRRLEIQFYEAELLQGQPCASVHTEISFVPLCALSSYEFCPADQIFLEHRINGEGTDR